jgi:hypothetical protein
LIGLNNTNDCNKTNYIMINYQCSLIDYNQIYHYGRTREEEIWQKIAIFV